MAVHDCETYDFPVMTSPFGYNIIKKIVPQLGGTWKIAVQEAIDEAKGKATQAGETAMAGETCAKPCDRLIYIDVSIDKIVPQWSPGKKGKELMVPITGEWKAGILCFKTAEEHKEPHKAAHKE